MSVVHGSPGAAAADGSDRVGFAESIADLALAFQDDSAERPSLVEQIVAGAVAVLPGVVSAAVELRRGEVLSAAVVQGDGTVLQLMHAQNEVGQGTCVQAWDQWQQIVTPDVTGDDRWLVLGAVLRKRQVEVRAVVCTPMEVAGRKVGVLTLVGDRPRFGQVDGENDVAVLARVFAAHAAVALAGEMRSTDLTAALGRRDVIGQAKGILIERFKISSPAAFAMLVKASSVTNTKLVAVCEHLVRTGEIPTATTRRPHP